MKEALLYDKREEKKTQCRLCAHRCLINSGKMGICGVRLNKEGVLYTLTYQKLISAHIDPIEKKPLYHFYPGIESYSIATMGCNFKCDFCQNASISQVKPGDLHHGRETPVDDVVGDIQRNNCPSISYTYTEPTIYFEYALEIAKKTAKYGIKNILVSNGYQTEECINMWAPYIDAINIDLKSYDDAFYRKYCGASIGPVLDSIKEWYVKGVWIELTTLIIPGLNDSAEETEKIIDFILSLDRNMVWHISRFAPAHQMYNHPSTPSGTLYDIYGRARQKGLRYVYIGNIINDKTSSTYCPQCGKLLIKRSAFSATENHLDRGKCFSCGTAIAGRFET